MKKYCLVLLILLGLMGLYGCGAGSSESDDEGSSGIRELTENEIVTAEIETEGDVDWYSFNAVEVNRTLSVNCSGTFGNSPVDFMMTVYEQDADGNMVPLFGRSAPEDAALAADLEIMVAIDQPKRIYIAVRDFMDDDASDRIHYQLEAHYTTDATDTGTFAQAQDIEVDAATCQYDSISEVGEVNTYRFAVETEGVYRLTAQYNVSDTSTVDVNLGIELYDDGGQLVYQYKGSRPHDLSYSVPVHLVSGSYFVVIDDQGRNNTDTANYTICVNSVSVTEMGGNDTLGDASENTPDVGGYVLDGTLEYLQDQDWYLLNVPEASSATAFQNIIIQFARDMTELPDSLSQLTYPGTYRITLQDSQGNVLHEYSQSVTVGDTYSVQIAAGIGEMHYITVQPVIEGQMAEALPYQLRVQLVEVNDENENGDEVTVLDPAGETVTGKISTLADVDKFQITVDNTAQPKVLELYFDTTEASMVDYSLYVQLPDKDLPVVITDTNGSQNGVDEGDHFKTSYYLPAGATSASEINIDVRDHQNNDGSDVEYTLTVDVLDIPTGSVSEVSGIVTSPVYNAEPDERADATGRTVTVVEYDSEGQPEFNANTTLLNVDALDGNNQWQSEWIAGFVDYDGDRDLYQLIVDDITQAEGAPEQWYFDIQVEFYAAASSVEYGWSLFRDRQPNDVLLERTFWDDVSGEVYEYDTDAEGIIACWSDMEITSETQHITIPRVEDGDFWVGYGWSDSRYYFSIQDFNRANESVTYDAVSERNVATPNQVPDNDWGNTNSSPAVPPYYFQVTVTFHPGCATPDDTDCTP